MREAHLPLVALALAAFIGYAPSSAQSPSAAPTPSQDLAALGPDGLAFSIENMDQSVDPADDFARYASGGWLDRVERPADAATFGFAKIVGDRVNARLTLIVEAAAAEAGTASTGTPEQQIGTLYNAYMDVAAINAAGVEPIRTELDRIAAIATKDDFATYLGRYTTITNQWPLVELDVFEGLDDATVNQVYVQPGEPGLALGAVLAMPADAPAKQLYADYIASTLTIAGYEADRAPEIARTAIAIESALHAGKLDPVLRVDYRNWNNPRTFDELQAELPDLSLNGYVEALGLARPDTMVVTDKDYPAALAGVLRGYSIGQLKDYLAYRLIQRFSPLLTTDFEEPGRRLNEAFTGVGVTPPRDALAIAFVTATLAQPLGKLYVDRHFDEATRDEGLDMIRRLQAAFRHRLVANDWLSESTRREALAKVDAFYYKFGIPDAWIDYSGLEIGTNLVQDAMSASAFAVSRKMARAGNPVENWAFSNPQHTAPTIVNAAYNSSKNGFEVTAAIAQPPAFEADMDAPIYYCRLGAVIGHEMTHGFDSGGRSFDARGNMRNWWADADAAHFDREAQKLVDQGNRYEALPGVFLNGGISVKENMADVGGITLAYDALMSYLEEHPAENVEIDGFTPTERCFIAWAQLWAEKSSEQMVKVQLENSHPPGPYRSFAPLQHLDAFYEAFGIVEGDAMWLPAEQRIRVW